MEGTIHIVRANGDQYWVDGAEVNMVVKYTDRSNIPHVSIHRKDGKAAFSDEAVFVEIIHTKPTEVKMMKNEEMEYKHDFRSDDLIKVYSEMRRINEEKNIEKKKRLPHGRFQQGPNAVRFLTGAKSAGIHTVGHLLDFGSVEFLKIMNVGKGCVNAASQALESLYGIKEW